MNTDFYYSASQESVDVSAAKNKPANRIEKGIKRLLFVAAIIFIAQLIWLFGISPFIPFSTLEVHGIAGLDRAEILHLAGINETSSFFTTNAKDVQERLSRHILVESAVVMKRFPDRISVFLSPRKPAAVTLANFNLRQVPLYIDRHGVFYKFGEPGSLESLNLPVLSGIENPQLNMRLPLSLVSLLDNLNQMAITSPELLSAISEIRIEPKIWDGYELVIFPVHSSIRVRIDNNLTEDTIRYLLLMLSVFENDHHKPQEIDFRSGIGSYKI